MLVLYVLLLFYFITRVSLIFIQKYNRSKQSRPFMSIIVKRFQFTTCMKARNLCTSVYYVYLTWSAFAIMDRQLESHKQNLTSHTHLITQRYIIIACNFLSVFMLLLLINHHSKCKWLSDFNHVVFLKQIE